ncbi:MAG: topoisomerase DNA-binding C4 zinc finger domain-containing protein, partial [Phycisphaerae bacterium]|nr:topoisomerase DNA-binding C4 zinc finger domain-containing protein [Phycisphaerae bacterium]
LVKALEAGGIGRPSTYAAIIQTIQDRSYVEQIDRAFRPTDLGVVVTDKLIKHFPQIFDVGFTSHMEDQLDKVEDAQAKWTEVLDEFYKPFSDSLKKATEQMDPAGEPSQYTCEKCGQAMVYRVNKNGKFLACTGYPQCKTTHPVDADGKKIDRVEVSTPCPNCSKKMVLRRSRYGIFLGCSDYPNCKGTLPCDENGDPLKRITEADIHETCSECGSGMQVKWKGRRAFLGCSQYPKCRNTSPLPDGVYIEPPRKPKPKDAGVACPKCGKAMVIRSGKRGEFLACSGYPKCRNAMDLSKLDELKAQQNSKKTTAK